MIRRLAWGMVGIVLCVAGFACWPCRSGSIVVPWGWIARPDDARSWPAGAGTPRQRGTTDR